MGFEPQHKISLTEVVPVNVFDQRLPEVGLNFSRQRFSVGKGEVIENIASRKTAGFIPVSCDFHVQIYSNCTMAT